jgi:uncharacterized protein involved in exopolysaccharide biosynthesis
MSYNHPEAPMSPNYSSSFPPPPQRLPAPILEASDFLKRNALLIAGIGVTIAFWVGLYAWFAYKPHFSSKAVVIIKDSAVTSRYVQPDHNYVMQTTSSSSSNPVLNSMGLLKSNMISEALWKYLQDEHPEELKKMHIHSHREWEAAFQDGSGFIKAKNLPGTDLISIQFSWTQAPVAKEGLDTVIKAFQDGSRDLNKAEEISRTRYLSLQSKDLADQLRDIRHRKSLYRAKIGTVSLMREQDDLAASRLDLTNKLSQIEAQASGKESASRNYQNMLRMSPTQAMEASAVGQNMTMSKLQDELYRLRELYSVLHASLSDTNPKIREIRAQMAEVEANIQSENSRTLGAGTRRATGSLAVADMTRSQAVGDMLKAQGEAHDLRSQAQVTRTRLAEVNRVIRTYPAYVEEMSNLDQQENSLSQALDQLRQKVIESRIKEEQTLSNVFVVDAPRLPEKPQFPTQIHLTILGLMLGLGTGVAIAFARERMFLSQPNNNANNDGDDNNHPPRGGSGPGGWLDPLETPAPRSSAKASRPVSPRIDLGNSLNMDAPIEAETPAMKASPAVVQMARPKKKAKRAERRAASRIRPSATMNPELYDWANSAIPAMYALDEETAFPELVALQLDQPKESLLKKAVGSFKRINEQTLTAVVTLTRNERVSPMAQLKQSITD